MKLAGVGCARDGNEADLAQKSFEDLLRRVPTTTKAVMLIDVTAVHASPLAVRKGWKDRHEAEFVKRPLILPPEAESIVLAAEMNANREPKRIGSWRS